MATGNPQRPYARQVFINFFKISRLRLTVVVLISLRFTVTAVLLCELIMQVLTMLHIAADAAPYLTM